ncbi:PASTA domain-containing protein, partial [Streptomyces sp. URMC 123]|uniref:Stk1 family PASTA domain-containing Ser/Thr kinase n=1 Tax=Streptomyces sp. URMC 123 TaxID=3423403 RepID=UPI003F1A29F4
PGPPPAADGAVDHTALLEPILEPLPEPVRGPGAEPAAAPPAPARPPAGRTARRLPRRGPLALIVAALLLLGVGTGVWYIASGRYTTVPAVLDLPQKEAVKALRGEGLDVKVAQDFSDTVERGHVIGTDPAPGRRIRDTGTVTVTVSRGPEVVKVPDLAGSALAKAQQELKDAGLVPGMVSQEFSDQVPQGAVVRTDPKAGTERKPDSAIAITVSKGRPIEVPNVVGAAGDAAARTLRDAGFTVRIAPERVFSDTAKDGVARQSPAEGARLARGDTVTLTLSKGPEMVVVPDVTGKKSDEAKKLLTDAGFTVDVSRSFPFFGDTVGEQSVKGGEQAPKGSRITIRLKGL